MSKSKTILQIVQEAAKLAKFRVPSVLVGASDSNARTFLATLHDIGSDLRISFDWPQLQRKATITLVAGQQQYELPSDFDRVVDRTLWDSSNLQVNGPIFGEEFQAFEELSIGSVVSKSFHVRGWDDSQIYIYPTPGSGAGSISYLYQSWQWIRPQKWTAGGSYGINDRVWSNGVRFTTSTGGVAGSTTPTPSSLSDGVITWAVEAEPQEYAQADTDVPLLDSELLKYALATRILNDTGMDASTWQALYSQRLERIKPQLSGSPTICFSSKPFVATQPYIPEGSW